MNEEQVKDNLKSLLGVMRSVVRQLPEDSDTRRKVAAGLKVLRGGLEEEGADMC
ncbi:MAG: hypothetical protein GY953_31810 [bacterium]|nr:hypothetical protein [bacterium]